MTHGSPEPEPANQEQPHAIDSSMPQSARIWNYWLGSKDNYAVDREVGEHLRRLFPGIVEIARAQRAFLRRTVTHLAGHAGVRQFLDIGTGLPTQSNTHEVAQSVAPESRVVYVDNDPLVLLHARALLVGTPEGATDYVDADVRDPDTILRSAAGTLDLTRPTALVMLGLLGHVVDDGEAGALVDRLVSALPSGSYLVLCDDTNVINGTEMDAMVRYWNDTGEAPRVNRSPEQLGRFFDGLEMLEPGMVSVPLWRPEPTDLGTPVEIDDFGAVGYKP